MSTRTLFTLALATLAALCGAAPAAARILEIGETAQPPTPSCPATPCFVASRTTGYQAKVGAQRGLHVVPETGRIVAWSITLSDPEARQSTSFDQRYGAASARISILRPGRRRQYARMIMSSPVQRLESYFGETVQFPLDRSLRVEKGWIVALTVPTWAPALAIGFGNDHSWRAASRRNGDCEDRETQQPQTDGSIARYRCLFRTARLGYTATLITSPARGG